MNEEQLKFNELTQSFAYLNTKFKELLGKSKIAEPISPTTQDCMDAMYAAISNVHDRMSNLGNSMYSYQEKHQRGHIPPINSPDEMNKALAALGQDGNYQAQKKTVYATKDLFVINNK